jgi:type I restriction-modification system DNA methylase subunit
MPKLRKLSANQPTEITNGQIMLPLTSDNGKRQGLSMLEKRLWEVADQLRANSKLKASEYSIPVLGLIFLRYADHKFSRAEQELKAKQGASSRRMVGKADYQARV